MRISFILPGYPWRPVGAFRVVYEYANQLVARGHHVAVVHARRVRFEEDFWAPRGIYRGLRRSAARLRDATVKPNIAWGRLDTRVQTIFAPEPTAEFVPEAEAVIAGAWGVAPYLLWYSKEKGEKFHLIQHYATTFGLPKPWVDTIWRAPVHNIFIANWQAETARQIGIPDPVVIPNGINMSVFHVARPIEERPKKVAMLFSPRDWKGPADGIEALEVARRTHPDIKAVFFGVTPKLAQIPSWVEYHQDPAQERLVHDVYNSSRVFLCPSWSEGFPLPPLEAMACGCAVVTTACGGVCDYAEHEKNALVSQPRNPERLAENLIRVLDDDALRLRLAQAGVERAREFTWERSTDKLESLLRDRVSASNQTASPAIAITSR